MIKIHGKDVPTELAELVDPRITALVVVDVQNDFCSPGGLADRAGADLTMYRSVIPRIAMLAACGRDTGVPIVNVQMLTLKNGASDSPSWLRVRLRANKNFNPDNQGIYDFTVEGTWGAELVPELNASKSDFYVSKFRSSAFHKTGLDVLLRSNGIRNVLITGCTTEGCVESTVRDACFYDYFPVLVTDCVASDVPELHEASLRVMSAYRTDVATSNEVMEVWQRSKKE